MPGAWKWGELPASGAAAHYWTGTVWQPVTLHVWTGSAWEIPVIHYWDGAAWV